MRREKSASNKQNNILVNNHQGTRCFGTSPSVGAAEESEERSHRLKSLKRFRSLHSRPSPPKQRLHYAPFIKTHTKENNWNIQMHMGRRQFIILKSFSSIVLSQYNKSSNILKICTILLSIDFKFGYKNIPSENLKREQQSRSHCVLVLVRNFQFILHSS